MPTLWQINLLSKWPFLFWLLPSALPFLAALGLYISFLLGKKLPILFQIGRYGLVGTANTAMDFGILSLLSLLTKTYSGYKIFGLDFISFSVATLHSFGWNKFWTFESKEKKAIAKELPAYLIVTILVIFLNALIVYLITTLIVPLYGFNKEQWLTIAKVFATIFSGVLNFIGYKFIVFKKDDSTLPQTQTPKI